jgi:integrase
MAPPLVGTDRSEARGAHPSPAETTEPQLIGLNAPALTVLQTIPRIEGNPYVICGDKAGQHLVNLQNPWRRIRKAAKLDDVRLHDLRYSFASVAASGGQSLVVIGRMLGHWAGCGIDTIVRTRKIQPNA